MEKNPIVDKIFENHHQYYNSIGVETIKQQAAQFKQVSDAYQGRVIFELLQNAIDRADKKILVLITEIDEQCCLIVANDGENFTYNMEHDYENGGNTRFDFQSLCSIATSTKDSSRFIGNKGVGFKSVFSISKLANIYSKGRILPGNEILDIDFQILNQFCNANELSRRGLKAAIDKLEAVQKENEVWGIPGYYFPIRLNETQRPDKIKELFNQEFVTIISVPINSDKLDSIVNKLRDIKKYHFHFVADKHHTKQIEITFKIDGDTFYTTSTESILQIVSRKVSENTRQLAKDIGLNISEDAKVSLLFKDSNEKEGVIYNFMPTDIMSPIRFVDINADFQTSVDRKNIMLSHHNDEKIGRYNNALLTECLALYKDCLTTSELLPNDFFSPYHLIVREGLDYETIQILRDLFMKDFESYVTQVIKERPLGYEIVNYQYFYSNFLLRLVSYFHSYGCEWKRFSDLVYNCGSSIRSSNAKFLPDIEKECQNKIFLTDCSENIKIPKQIKAEISTFKFDFWEYVYGLNGIEMLKKGLNLSEFEQSDEIYRLYRQCRNDGYYNNESLSDDEQTSILASVGKLMKTERNKDVNDCSAWRFIPIISSLSEGRDVAIKGRAGVALSSLFFKTKDGKYKPAQLLRESDIDSDFLHQVSSKIGDDFEIDLLLRKVGVSKRFIYADERLVNIIGDGLTFIPSIISEPNPKNYYTDTLSNIRIYDDKNCSCHPTSINENYTYLFVGIRMNDDFRALAVGKYTKMPRAYIDCLKKHLLGVCQKYVDNSFFTDELYQFYQKYFSSLYENNIIIIKVNNNYKIVTENDDFIIVDNRRFFDLDTTPKPVLYYVSAQEKLPEKLRPKFRQLHIKYDDSQSDEPENGLNVECILKQQDTIARLLCQISKSKLSESIYDESSITMINVVNQIKQIEIKERTSIITTCTIDDEGIWSTPFKIPFFYDKTNKILYIESIDSQEALSRNIAARAIANTIFHNEGLSPLIENILFYNSYVDPEFVSKMNHRMQNPALNFVTDEDFDLDKKEPINNNTLNDNSNIINVDWDLIPNYDLVNYSNSFCTKSHSQIQINSGSSGGKTNFVTDKMIQTGISGEMIVTKVVANKFMDDFNEEQRLNAIKQINEFLLKEHFQPIETSSNQKYDNLKDVINLLWYTNQLEKQYMPFDIVTVLNGEVMLIEVKSTDGNDNFRLSCKETKVAMRLCDNYMIYRVSNNDRTITVIEKPFKGLSINCQLNNMSLTPAGFFVKLS
ncbi:MAG: DUF3883 domain-containing protein [Bacteroidales bacterium]|nr:DUF3883 domain-containing protein [Bacteroidales bacterium]